MESNVEMRNQQHRHGQISQKFNKIPSIVMAYASTHPGTVIYY